MHQNDQLIDRLEAENAAQAETIAALRAEVEALKVDAERYRWLRDNDSSGSDLMVCTGFDCETVGSSRVVGTYKDCLGGTALDAAIDAARKESA